MKYLLGSLTGLLVIIVAIIVLTGSCYTVKETEHVIVTRFGDIVGEPISEPGLRFKVPFVDTVNRLEKRLLNWDGRPITIPTKDKAYITVDTFARWRITDPKKFFIRFRDLRSAERERVIQRGGKSAYHAGVNIETEESQDNEQQSRSPQRKANAQSLNSFHLDFPLKDDNPRRVWCESVLLQNRHQSCAVNF